jgi:hypothetical protein
MCLKHVAKNSIQEMENTFKYKIWGGELVFLTFLKLGDPNNKNKKFIKIIIITKYTPLLPRGRLFLSRLEFFLLFHFKIRIFLQTRRATFFS